MAVGYFGRFVRWASSREWCSYRVGVMLRVRREIMAFWGGYRWLLGGNGGVDGGMLMAASSVSGVCRVETAASSTCIAPLLQCQRWRVVDGWCPVHCQRDGREQEKGFGLCGASVCVGVR
jgi:hypothetical protein